MLDARAAVDGSDVTGSFLWPYDPIFRPTVGVFVNGQLKKIVPTIRQPGASDDTRVFFSIAVEGLSEPSSGSEATLTCLELGAVIFQPKTASLREISSYAINIDSILSSPAPEQNGDFNRGFPWFLLLPVIDQINILYLDLFGRLVDPGGAEIAVSEIARGDITILDLRDRMLQSEEFWRLPSPQFGERIGAWCTWNGLEDLAATVLMPVTSEYVGLPEDGSENFFTRYIDLDVIKDRSGSHFAKLARMPARSNAKAVQSWMRRRGEFGRLLSARLARLAQSRNHEQPKQPQLTRFLLPIMEVGEAGKRVGSSIHSKEGAIGILAYGPYLKLAHGEYQAEIYMSLLAPESAPQILCEVRVGPVLLGICGCILSAHDKVRTIIPFEIPKGGETFFGDERLEILISTAEPSSIKIRSVALRRGGVDNPAGRSTFACLPKLRIGDGGRRLSDGSVVSPTAASTSYLVFGPYIKLLPGAYECVAHFESEEGNEEQQIVGAEVVDENGAILSAHRYRLMPGRSQVAFTFSVPHAENVARLIGPLEFRLLRHSAFQLKVRDVAVRRMADDLDVSSTQGAELIPDQSAPSSEGQSTFLGRLGWGRRRSDSAP